MEYWIGLLILFLFAEFITVYIVFFFIKKLFYPKKEDTSNSVPQLDYKDSLKGTIERIVITFALMNNIPHALIFFGAVKMGTRLKTETNSDDYNDFFLIGNLSSIGISILYAHVLFDPQGQVMKFVLSCIGQLKTFL